MASQRQINANRRNSARSTGPQSTSGRAASARNAIVHGLTAEKFGHLEDVAIIDTRMKEWKHEIKTDGTYQQWCARLAVAASVRADRARLHIDAWLCRQAGHAGGEGWDLDRNAEVEALACDLAREPGRVAAQLRRSLHGCRWLADRWRELAAAHARERGDDGAAAPL